MTNGYTAPTTVVVAQPRYYGRRAPNKTCCIKFLLVFGTIVVLLIGIIMTAVGHTRTSFWKESDDWCSFCKEDRLETENTNARLRVAGPVFLGIGGILLIISIVYCKKTSQSYDGDVVNRVTSQGTSAPATTTSYPPPQMYPSGAPPGSTMHYQPPQTTMGYPSPQPAGAPYPPQASATVYPPPASVYPPPPSGGGPTPYPVASAPPQPPAPGFAEPFQPPPSYDEAVDKY